MNQNKLFWNTSLESDTVEGSTAQNLDGYADQPVVAIYVPERDGRVNPLVDMEIQGAAVHYREWAGAEPLKDSVEGMQQMLHNQEEEEKEVRAEARMHNRVEAMSHDDYTLFVVDKDTDPQWYEHLGEVKELTGVLLEGNIGEHDVELVKKLEEQVGLESIFYTPGQAAVRIERVLHARGRL